MRILSARYQRRVYCFVLRLVRNEAAAEELLIESEDGRDATQARGRTAWLSVLWAIHEYGRLDKPALTVSDDFHAGIKSVRVHDRVAGIAGGGF
jgi:hypothetical protein